MNPPLRSTYPTIFEWAIGSGYLDQLRLVCHFPGLCRGHVLVCPWGICQDIPGSVLGKREITRIWARLFGKYGRSWTRFGVCKPRKSFNLRRYAGRIYVALVDFKGRSLEVTWHLLNYCCCLWRSKLESRGLPMLLGSEALDLRSDTLAFSICTVEWWQR